MKYIIDLKDLSKSYNEEIGEKAANLGEFYEDFNIPKGFIILGEKLISVLDEIVGKTIDEHISKINFLDDESIQFYANSIQKNIVFAQFPKEIETKMLLAYKSINYSEKTSAQEILEEKLPVVAVRTSFPQSFKLPKKSIQQVNYLNIHSEERFIKAIKTSLASLFLKDMLKFCYANNFSWRDFKFSILIQEMINVEKSGRVMSYIPKKLTQDIVSDENTIIFAVFGLGESISGGFVQPDVYVADSKNLHNIVFKNRGAQLFAYTLDEKRMKTAKIDLGERGKEQVLDDKQITNLSMITNRIKKQSLAEVIVEWGIKDNKIYLFQINFGEVVKKEKMDTSNETYINNASEQSSVKNNEFTGKQGVENDDIQNSQDNGNNNNKFPDYENNLEESEEKLTDNLSNQDEFNKKDIGATPDLDIQKESSNIEASQENQDFNKNEKQEENFLEESKEQNLTKEDLAKEDFENMVSVSDDEKESALENNLKIFSDDYENTPLGKEEIDINEILEIYDKTINPEEESKSNEKDIENQSQNQEVQNRDDDLNTNNSVFGIMKNNSMQNQDNNSNPQSNEKESYDFNDEEDEKETNNNSGFLLSNFSSKLNLQKEQQKISENQDIEVNDDIELIKAIENKIKRTIEILFDKNFQSYNLIDIAESMKIQIGSELYENIKSLSEIIRRTTIRRDISQDDLTFAYQVLTKVRALGKNN